MCRVRRLRACEREREREVEHEVERECGRAISVGLSVSVSVRLSVSDGAQLAEHESSEQSAPSKPASHSHTMSTHVP